MPLLLFTGNSVVASKRVNILLLVQEKPNACNLGK